LQAKKAVPHELLPHAGKMKLKRWENEAGTSADRIALHATLYAYCTLSIFSTADMVVCTNGAKISRTLAQKLR